MRQSTREYSRNFFPIQLNCLALLLLFFPQRPSLPPSLTHQGCWPHTPCSLGSVLQRHKGWVRGIDLQCGMTFFSAFFFFFAVIPRSCLGKHTYACTIPTPRFASATNFTALYISQTSSNKSVGGKELGIHTLRISWEKSQDVIRSNRVTTEC